jgi:HK97 family phage major capsid protein
MASFETIESELKSFIGRHGKKSTEVEARLLALEQRATSRIGGDSYSGGGGADIASTVLAAPEFKSFLDSTSIGRTGRIRVPGFETKTTITSGTTNLNASTLVAPDFRPGIVPIWPQRLRVRDLLPTYPTTSNSIEFPRESSEVNNAAMQVETVAKGESEINFELVTAPVRTLAHWIPASRQILDDAPALSGFLNNRLSYMLRLAEETELLFGVGTGVHLAGLVTEGSVYDTTRTNVASDTLIDVISHAMEQVYDDSNLEADGIILNPQDWESIRLIKQTGSGISSGQYIFSDPHLAGVPTLWGCPVVVSKSMPKSQFLVGAFQQGAAIFDRMQATVEISREHSDYFTRNLVAVLCEERLALAVFTTSAFCYGGFPFGS